MKSIYKIGKTSLLTVLLLVAAIIIANQAMDAYAAATAGTATKRTYVRSGLPPLDVISLTLTMNTDGTSAAISQAINGRIVCVETNPGTTAPTDNYDLTVNIRGGDIMGGTLANRDTANTEWAAPAAPAYLFNEAPTITAAGNSVASATVGVVIYVERHQ